jgi:hypothetical protein
MGSAISIFPEDPPGAPQGLSSFITGQQYLKAIKIFEVTSPAFKRIVLGQKGIPPYETTSTGPVVPGVAAFPRSGTEEKFDRASQIAGQRSSAHH